jgi:7-carboxy-7-deazaguanine synthase
MENKNIMVASARNLKLVNNGIFPIKYGSDGNLLDNVLDTGLSIPGTIQGEGKLIGTPCLFIRTSTCNLSCSWIGTDGNGSPCDTPYSSHFPENNKMSIEEILLTVKHNIGNLKHIVISGGEPMLQGRRLYDLLVELKMTYNLHITIETNGTIYIPEVASVTSLASISPKLSSSTPWAANLKNTAIAFNENTAKSHEKNRINIAALQRWINWRNEDKGNRDFQFKFVVSNIEQDSKEIKYILSLLTGWNSDDVCIMPEGVDAKELMEKTNDLTNLCIENGWRFTPRLHALIWGVKRSV